ncbi:MAG: hypothetical protein OXF44_12120 [Anaerolineaceae bacterium]|nr:hypothetical protein [Anaerolineaceae bacterium]MCY4024458.1 hypothetical protein [Anaerolineaceae bacterium]
MIRALPTGGLLLLLVSWLALINLLPVEEGGLTRVLVMLTLSGLTLPVLWLMHRSGVAHQLVILRKPGAILLLLLGLQLIQVFLWIGLAPQVHRTGEFYPLIAGVRQSADIRSFIMTPDRNADTWFNFFMLWPISGYYMRFFGVGIDQARFFYLLVSALALPFIGAIASRLYGRTAAFCAVAVGIAIPLQYNWALSHCWVATSTAIAIYATLRAHDRDRPMFWSFVAGIAATSAVEGHVYGGAFSVTFCLLWFWRWIRARRRSLPAANTAFFRFLAGCLIFTLIWGAYHIALPGLSLSEVPGILRETWDWEAAISNPTAQVGFTPANVLLQLKIYLYSAPVEFLLLIVVVVAALLRRSRADRLLLTISAGALILTGLFFAHVNDFYLIFVFPFFAVWFGAWLSRLGRSTGASSSQEISLSGAGFLVLMATILLYALFAHARSLEHGLIQHRRQIERMTVIGREIDSLLPASDIVVAGDAGYYLGMPHRLNYAAGFSFTWNLPKYWAFDRPEAVIVTAGVDDGYSNLGSWLIDHDFRPARCFSLPGLGDETTILFLTRDLMPREDASNCPAAWLATLATP